jgi:hypothetical protein
MMQSPKASNISLYLYLRLSPYSYHGFMYRYIVMGQNPGTLLFTPKYFANAWLLIFQEWFDKH